MTSIIARKEITEMLRDGRVRWCGGIVLALLAMAFLAAALPRFAFEDESPSAPVARILSALLGILAPTALLGFSGLTMMRRYRLEN